MSDKSYMQLALREAKKAYNKNEVPIGCVIVRNGKKLVSAHNKKTLNNIATHHAEILAIEKACLKLNTWYLDDCVLYTTVEPCMMCTGAIIQARIKRVVYGVKNSAFGYLSKLNLSKIEVRSGVLENECQILLSSFFKEKRLEKCTNDLKIANEILSGKNQT